MGWRPYVVITCCIVVSGRNRPPQKEHGGSKPPCWLFSAIKMLGLTMYPIRQVDASARRGMIGGGQNLQGREQPLPRAAAGTTGRNFRQTTRCAVPLELSDSHQETRRRPRAC